MNAISSLSAVSFLTSMMTAAVGIGGGLGLLAVMPAFLPMPAVVPVHGVTQFVSNASRFAIDFRHAETHLLPAYLTGAALGSAGGFLFIGSLPDVYLSALLGIFILLCTWTGLVKRLGRVLTSFFSLGFVQAFLSLFVASVGLISQPVLLRQGLSKDRVIVTHAMQMSVLHGFKVAAFVAAGFPFLRYWLLMAVMVVASAAGSYAGSRLRNRIPERAGVLAMRAGITFFAIKMIVDPLLASFNSLHQGV